ncbi:MAG: hypothetical protein HQ525_09995 [Anaerolineae bacterium]|nr:hypothetical protein [Anaerolineae bacterium]
MDFNTLYGFILIGAGLYGLRAAYLGMDIEKSETPRFSRKTSRVIYAATGIVLIIFGILRLN